MHLSLSTLVAFALSTSSVAFASSDVPPQAKALIKQVNRLSAKGDLVGLRSLMVSEFTWSFGGDANADQAISNWRENPKQLQALAKATSKQCELKGKYVECPRNAGMSLRAGFAETKTGWRMTYFVEGD